MKPPRHQQYRLDYEQHNRERRQLVWAIAHERTGLTRRQWCNVQAVLVFLINADRGEGMVPYIATIARACNLSRRTVDRAIADAKRLGILKAETRTNKRGRASNTWHIDFAAMARLGDFTGANQRQLGVDRRQDGANSRQDGVDQLKEFNSSPPLLNPSTTSQATSTTTWAAATVEEVEGFKKKFEEWVAASRLPEVFKLDDALTNALNAGCTINEVGRRVSWFAKNQIRFEAKHRGSVLYHGIKNAEPGQAEHLGWFHKQ